MRTSTAGPKRPGAIAPILCLAATALTIAMTAASAEPYRPTDDATVLGTIPPALLSSQADLRSRQQDLAAKPGDLKAALEVARIAFNEGRAAADPRRIGQAEAVLRPWWTAADIPTEARVMRAVIRQYMHDFNGALEDLGVILAADPNNAQARLSRAFVYQTMGSYAAAKDDCHRLPRAVGLTPVVACVSRLDALTGAAPKALDQMSRLAMVDTKADAQLRRWGMLIAAEAAEIAGRRDDAGRNYESALAMSSDIATLVAYADFLLDADRPAEVIKLLGDRTEADVALLRLAIAGARVDDPRATGWIDLLQERFAAARATGNQLHLREEARFELDVRKNPLKALPIALENWKSQKEPADARLVLEAAVAANDARAAADVLAFLKTSGLDDSRLKSIRARLQEMPS